MERVTLEDPRLREELARHCAFATRNLMPGYRGPQGNADDRRVERAIEEGDASSNIAVFFSLPSGELLHVVPGFSSAGRLGRELAFALSVRDATRGLSRAEAERVAAAKHRERALSLSADPGRVRANATLVRAHELLGRRPLVDASLIGPDDYALDGPSGPGKVLFDWEQ